MSTLAILKSNVQQGKLQQFLPESFFGEQPKRGLYMPPELHKWVNDDPKERDEQDRRIFIRERLAVFVNGEHVDNRFYMKKLHKKPTHIWEIKIADIIPQYRIFGMFALPDTFICSHVVSRPKLGKFESAEWQKAKNFADDLWNILFPNIPRFKGENFKDYVTENGGHYD